MADLYVSLLGAPFRALAVSLAGPRALIRMGDLPEDEFGLDPFVWLDPDAHAVGGPGRALQRANAPGVGVALRLGVEPAAGVEPWTRRDIAAAILRRFVVEAERQVGEPVGRLVCVAPPGLGPEPRGELHQAAILAGAAASAVVGAEALLERAASTGVAPGAQLLAEAWNDGLRLTPAEDAKSIGMLDLADWDAARVRSVLAEVMGSAGLGVNMSPRAFRAILDRVFAQWTSAEANAQPLLCVEPGDDGAPVYAYVPASLLAQAELRLAEGLAPRLEAAGIDLKALGPVVCTGPWSQPLARALQQIAPDLEVVQAPRLAFEAALSLQPPGGGNAPNALSGDVRAVPVRVGAARALAQGDPVDLLKRGLRLPATFVTESFDTSTFLNQFAISAQLSEGEARVVTVVPIPRFAEAQAHSYLKVVVHQDTPDLMLVETAYLYSTDRRFGLLDKATGQRREVPGEVFRQLREVG